MIEFLTMGGYAFYVWMAYGVTALAIVLEIVSLRGRARRTLRDAHSSLPEEAPITTRSSLDPAGMA